MSSLSVSRRGVQEPRIRSCPDYTSTAGPDVTRWLAAVGVNLDPWQALWLTDGLAMDAQGAWLNFEVAGIVARQNGKGEVLLARQLAGLFLFGERLIIHSAHEFKTASEAFQRLKNVVDASDELSSRVKITREGSGTQGIELKNGARIRFLARSKGSGRGFTCDCLILDEAYELGAAAMAAMLPTLSAVPNPQVWYASSAGMVESEQLNAVRVRGVAGDDPSLCYLEWSALRGADPTDRQAWAQANPALGYRVPETFIEREQRTMPPEEFDRERLSIWSDARAEAVIPMDAWEACRDELSEPVGRVFPALDIPPDRSTATIGVAGVRTDGRQHLEIAVREDGIAWVVPRLVEFQRNHRSHPVILDPAGPAGSLITDLDAAGVRYTLVTMREYGQACGALYDAVVAKNIAHRGDQPPLTAALLAAKKRSLGDAWAWDRKDSTDISPLVAVTLAKHGLDVSRNGGALGLIH